MPNNCGAVTKLGIALYSLREFSQCGLFGITSVGFGIYSKIAVYLRACDRLVLRMPQGIALHVVLCLVSELIHYQVYILVLN